MALSSISFKPFLWQYLRALLCAWICCQSSRRDVVWILGLGYVVRMTAAVSTPLSVPPHNILVNCICPGSIDTPMLQIAFWTCVIERTCLKLAASWWREKEKVFWEWQGEKAYLGIWSSNSILIFLKSAKRKYFHEIMWIEESLKSLRRFSHKGFWAVTKLSWRPFPQFFQPWAFQEHG